MASAERIDLTSATITTFEDNAAARATITAADGNGVTQFVPGSILQADGSSLLHMSIDRLTALLLDTCEHTLPPEGTNEDLGLVTALLAANEGGGDAAARDLRNRRAIIGQAFEFLVTSTTPSGEPRSGMRRAQIGEATYLLLQSRNQTAPPPLSSPSPASSFILPPATDLHPKSTTGKRGRDSDISSEAGDTRDGEGTATGGAALRTDFDLPKQDGAQPPPSKKAKLDTRTSDSDRSPKCEGKDALSSPSKESVISGPREQAATCSKTTTCDPGAEAHGNGFDDDSTLPLSPADIAKFEEDGYVMLRGAFDGEVASACRDRLWRRLRGEGVTMDNSATWVKKKPIGETYGLPWCDTSRQTMSVLHVAS